MSPSNRLAPQREPTSYPRLQDFLDTLQALEPTSYPRLQDFLDTLQALSRSLVFSGSQAKNISYSIDYRHKIFRTLSITGKKYVFYRKDISVSTSWWEVANAWFFRITGKKYFVGPVAGSVGI